MRLGPLSFQPIDLSLTTDLCIRFREDSFVSSFGDASKFYQADGKGAEKYIEWLRGKISNDPSCAVHVWLDSTIIGQMELGVFNSDPTVGYVYLYYLIPDSRGLGYSSYLDQYTSSYFLRLGLTKCRLSVSPTNTSALRFYEKNGWLDLGPRPGHPEVHWMEKVVGLQP
jgi:RimJ/RimL family protein N-acetyltransferase